MRCFHKYFWKVSIKFETHGSFSIMGKLWIVLSAFPWLLEFAEAFYWYFSPVQFSCSVLSDSLRPHGQQHARPPCPSPTPGVYSDSGPLSQWCHPAISSSVVPFSSCLQSFPAPGSFLMSQFFTLVSQSIGISASASVLPINIQGWFSLGLTGLISW